MPALASGDFLEVGGRDVRRSQILRILHDLRDDEPRVAVRRLLAFIVFSQHRCVAVRGTGPAQIPRFEPPARTSRGWTGRPVPFSVCRALPGRLARLYRRTELEQSRLLTGVGIDAQGVVAFPLDAQAPRHAHDICSAVRTALLTIGGILLWIPGVTDAPPFRIEGQTVEYALVRREHAELPVLRHHRNPV